MLLTIITKRYILDVAAALDPPLLNFMELFLSQQYEQWCWFLSSFPTEGCLISVVAFHFPSVDNFLLNAQFQYV